MRSRDTEVKVFDGEVESLAVAEVDGRRRARLADGRQGYAWAGSLDPDVVAETRRRGPRQRRRSARPTRRYGLARRPTRLRDAAGDLDLWRERARGPRPTEKVALALELERGDAAADPRVRGVESASYGDAAVEVAVANSLGVEASTRRTVCSVVGVRDGRRGRRTQTGYGFSVGRTFADLDVDDRGRGRGRACRRDCSARRSRRPAGCPSSSTRW